MLIGINTKGIYYPQLKKREVLEETANNGYSRIEISYYFTCLGDNKVLYDGCFTRDSDLDIEAVLLALWKVEGLCHAVPTLELFQLFERRCKTK